MISLHDLAMVAKNTRDAQSRYFKTRSDKALTDARAWEVRLDKAIETVLKSSGLFDNDGERAGEPS